MFKISLLQSIFVFAFASLLTQQSFGQSVQCDPTKVMTAEACAKCHANELSVWKKTPHFTTYADLSRRPRSKEICKNLGLRSVKRSDVCIKCHYTLKDKGGKNKPVSGISCESCHGASRDWLTMHNDYGGPTATKASETPSNKKKRLDDCLAVGMNNTQDLYSIAMNCLNCHTVPNEELVNVGGHVAGSETFELVSWSQGMMRHNFLRGDNVKNVESTPERLRVMFVVGLIADLEYSTRATAAATEKSKYGLTVAQRTAEKAVKLFEIQQEIKHADIEQILTSFSLAQLKINNSEQLNSIADQIREAGRKFAREVDGASLSAVDQWLPKPEDYKWKPSR